VKARNKATNDRWRLSQKKAAAKLELTPEQIAERKRKARDIVYSTNYRKKNEAAFKSGPDERPPGTQFNGTWRCPGCGGKMLGSVKRCLPCELTKQDDSNEQNEPGKYQTVYAEIE
jgi:hypothetical protein